MTKKNISKIILSTIITGLILTFVFVNTTNNIELNETRSLSLLKEDIFKNVSICNKNHICFPESVKRPPDCTINISENKFENLFTKNAISWKVQITCDWFAGDSVDIERWTSDISYENEEWQAGEILTSFKCQKWRSPNIWQDYFFGEGLCN